jgi:hypothetical protein
MITLFAVSLILLCNLFIVKLIELRSGEKLFWSKKRRRGDQFLQDTYRSIERYYHRGGSDLKQQLEATLTTGRRRLSDWLGRLSEYLR